MLVIFHMSLSPCMPHARPTTDSSRDKPWHSSFFIWKPYCKFLTYHQQWPGQRMFQVKRRQNLGGISVFFSYRRQVRKKNLVAASINAFSIYYFSNHSRSPQRRRYSYSCHHNHQQSHHSRGRLKGVAVSPYKTTIISSLDKYLHEEPSKEA